MELDATRPARAAAQAAQRVGLAADAAGLRAAYRSASRAWHPDRWVSFPCYQPAVTEVFAKISDTYADLRNAT